MLHGVDGFVKDDVSEEEKPPEGFPALDTESSNEDVDARIRQFAATMYHPCGSAAMGSALDSESRMNGVDRLRIIDASAFPGILAGHPQMGVYVLAERRADLVLGRG